MVGWRFSSHYMELASPFRRLLPNVGDGFLAVCWLLPVSMSSLLSCKYHLLLRDPADSNYHLRLEILRRNSRHFGSIYRESSSVIYLDSIMLLGWLNERLYKVASVTTRIAL